MFLVNMMHTRKPKPKAQISCEGATDSACMLYTYGYFDIYINGLLVLEYIVWHAISALLDPYGINFYQPDEGGDEFIIQNMGDDFVRLKFVVAGEPVEGMQISPFNENPTLVYVKDVEWSVCLAPADCEASEPLQLNATRSTPLTDPELQVKRDSIEYRLNNGSINLFTCSESAVYVEDFLAEFGNHLGRVAGEDQFGNQYNVLNEGGAYGGTAFDWYATRYYDEETGQFVDLNLEIGSVGLNDGVFNVSTTLRLFFRDDSTDFCAGFIDYEKFSPEPNTNSDQPVLILHSCAVSPYA